MLLIILNHQYSLKKGFCNFSMQVWDLRLINIILTRLIELELKCKLNYLSEKFYITVHTIYLFLQEIELILIFNN